MNNPTEKLEAAARVALTLGSGRVQVFELDGRRYVVKRLAQQERSRLQIFFMRWLVRWLTGRSLPAATLSLQQQASALDYEARRLQQLAAAGVRVPQVMQVTPEFFILEYCGAVVADQMEKWPVATSRLVLLRLARELAEFHRAGQWHGGAQIKNITLQDDLSYRIDFEENFGDFLPLPATQAADLVVFLNSISLVGLVDESESRQLLPQLLTTYFSVHPDEEIRRIIRRLQPLLRVFATLIRPFQRFSRKGIRRALILVDVLGGV